MVPCLLRSGRRGARGRRGRSPWRARSFDLARLAFAVARGDGGARRDTPGAGGASGRAGAGGGGGLCGGPRGSLRLARPGAGGPERRTNSERADLGSVAWLARTAHARGLGTRGR